MNKLILSIENDGQFLSEESDSGEEVDQVPGNDYLDDLYDDESEEDKDVVDDGNIVVVTEESRGGGNDYVDIVYDHFSMSDPDPPSWGGNGEDWEDMEAGDSGSDGDLNKDTKGNDYHDCRDYHDCHYPNPLKGNDYQDIVEN